MAAAANPEELRRLEQEMQQAIQRQDFMEAIEFCDEIEAKGWAKPAHLVAKAQCYLRARRKQDAQKCLLQVFDIDAGFQPAVQLLDEHFPGWTRPKPKPRTQAVSFGTPGGAPGAAQGGGAQGGSYAAQSQTSPGYSTGPAERQTGSQPPFHVGAAPAAAGGMTGMKIQSSPRIGSVSHVVVQQAQPGFTPDAPVNWNYVLEDLGLAQQRIKENSRAAVERDAISLEALP